MLQRCDCGLPEAFCKGSGRAWPKTGFTLIELLIVLMIIGLSAGLVGPAIFKSYDRLRMKIEEERVAELIAMAGRRAFFQQRSRQIEISSERLLIVPDNLSLSLHFSFLADGARKFEIDEKGLRRDLYKLEAGDGEPAAGG